MSLLALSMMMMMFTMTTMIFGIFSWHSSLPSHFSRIASPWKNLWAKELWPDYNVQGIHDMYSVSNTQWVILTGVVWAGTVWGRARWGPRSPQQLHQPDNFLQMHCKHPPGGGQESFLKILENKKKSHPVVFSWWPFSWERSHRAS